MNSDKMHFKIKAIAANIRNKREHRNYTQEYLAAKLDISQNAYSKIELGYTKITVERLFQIADVLEYDVTDLLSIKPDNSYFKGCLATTIISLQDIIVSYGY
ncbi:Helix-turn-helix [Mucilaginibacter mallensis]|uniref:Helix-turn-helix n=1 Tax=Mucilaginibacter mallensis TaxID=652787 RepID=A0A1H2C646_MUCMA|nr:helix-turn-helix transcriptional regulator [Mucilaginibacter mallensis]SDT65824.1 Helix-turn-helix [Mucilaginibacter mallensis]